MEKLAKKNTFKLIDLLHERLTFEQAGVKLYDTVLARVRASPDEGVRKLEKKLQAHRDEEQEHAEWLMAQLRDLGHDPRTPTANSVLVQTESEGIERVIRRDGNIVHDLHALLAAELSDNAGWDLLTQLADEFGDRSAKKEFKKRLHEEEDHLLFVRKAVLELSQREMDEAPRPAFSEV